MEEEDHHGTAPFSVNSDVDNIDASHIVQTNNAGGDCLLYAIDQSLTAHGLIDVGFKTPPKTVHK